MISEYIKALKVSCTYDHDRWDDMLVPVKHWDEADKNRLWFIPAKDIKARINQLQSKDTP